MANLVLTAIAAFLVTVPWGGWMIRWLRRRGIGKRIRADGPEGHRQKAGTPTMGGLYILIGMTLVSTILLLRGWRQVAWPFLAMLSFGMLGAVDDLQGLSDQEGVGWLARSKFPWQWALGLALGFLAYGWGLGQEWVIPVSNQVIDLGAWSIFATALLLVASSNAVNLTDGLDGLAAGCAILAYLAYIFLAAGRDVPQAAFFSAGVVGVTGAFLWYNAYPAQVFMGDTGSQALGAGLAAVAIISGHGLLLPVIGAVFVAEALSVMLQVAYFKLTRRLYGQGRRILRMAPLHHHFELGGMPESKITQRLWILAGVTAALGVFLEGISHG